jgi:Oxidoreductase molybdopterin binding domain
VGHHPKSSTAATKEENPMADEFVETDLETPTEADLDDAYSGRFLGVVDLGNKKIRTKIAKVGKEEIKDRETGRTKKRFIVFFESIDKPMLLNVVNKNALVDALGKNPTDWINAVVGIKNDPSVMFGTKRVGGVRLTVLYPPAKTELHFERHHGGIPTIDPNKHTMIVHGMLDVPKKFSMADIKRFPSVARKYFIECSGNGLTEWNKPTLKTSR